MDGYIPKETPDTLTCFKKISNCQKYDLTGATSKCLLCDNDYALDGTGENCLFINTTTPANDPYCWFKSKGLDANTCLLY